MTVELDGYTTTIDDVIAVARDGPPHCLRGARAVIHLGR